MNEVHLVGTPWMVYKCDIEKENISPKRLYTKCQYHVYKVKTTKTKQHVY